MIGCNINRRSFLKLPVFLPFSKWFSTDRPDEHHFQYENVVGTSMDLVVWTRNAFVAERACQTVLDQIQCLSRILDTRDPTSAISRLEKSGGNTRVCPELMEVLDAYGCWERRSGGVFSIRPAGAGTPRNVDALGKAYIIDCAASAVREALPSIEGLLLNVGGDIVTWGRPCDIAIADPNAWYDNARPIGRIKIGDAAIVTSGTYARGAHLLDARDGKPLSERVAATVVAPCAVTANALATTLCLTKEAGGLQLVESTPAAEAIRITSDGVHASSGFSLLKWRASVRQTTANLHWPQGYRLTVTLPLKTGRSSKRPYVAVWIEDSEGKLVRTLALWAGKAKYLSELSTAWGLLKSDPKELHSVTRATRPAGKYELVWDGLDNQQKPVPLGTYRIVVETNQEHGSYAKQVGNITLGDQATSITLPATTNFDAVSLQYGPA